MAFDKAPKNKVEYDRSSEVHSFELWDKCFAEAEVGNFAPAIEKNEKGEILAPNGTVSRLPNEDFVKVSRTPTFKKWFGDWVNDPANSSKVVYEDTGEPMVVYHGTSKDIKNGLILSEKSSIKDKRIYFTDNFKKAKNYSTNNGSVFSVFLNMHRIKFLKNPGVYDIWDPIKPQVFDSIKIFYAGEVINDFVILNTKQLMHTPSDIEGRRKAKK